MKPTTMSAHRSDLVTETLGPSDKKCEEKLLTNTEPELAATSQPFVAGTDLTLKDFVLPRELRFDTLYDEFMEEDCGSFPVIDLQRNFATTHGDRSSSTSSQLARAAATWGFFKVINHRVPPEIFEKNLANARSLFGKEVGEKRGIVGQAGTYLGYHEGTSLGAHSSWHENVGFPRSPEMLREMVRHVWPGDPVRAEELRYGGHSLLNCFISLTSGKWDSNAPDYVFIEFRMAKLSRFKVVGGRSPKIDIEARCWGQGFHIRIRYITSRHVL